MDLAVALDGGLLAGRLECDLTGRSGIVGGRLVGLGGAAGLGRPASGSDPTGIRCRPPGGLGIVAGLLVPAFSFVVLDSTSLVASCATVSLADASSADPAVASASSTALVGRGIDVRPGAGRPP